METANILTYTSLSSFLSDFYKIKKKESRSFSYQTWARSLKIKDRSYLKAITDGKRTFTEDQIQTLIEYFKFRGKEKQHLKDLLRFDRAATPAARDLLRRKIEERISYQVDCSTLEASRSFLQNPKIPLLATLVSFVDIDRTIKGLSVLMNEPETDISKWLRVLSNLSLVEVNADQEWCATKSNFRVPDQIGSQDLIAFHVKTLEKVISRIQGPSSNRRMDCMLLPLSPEEQSEFKELLQNFISRCQEKYQSNSLKTRTLYQVNMSLIPAL